MKKGLLFIDDDQDFLDLYCSLLCQEYEVAGCNSLVEAVHLLNGAPFKFDLIICDIFMPNSNGFEVYEFFKGHQEYKHLNIIFKTSSLNKSVIEEAIVKKGIELISTYMSNDEIVARIKGSISKSQLIKLRSGKKLHGILCKESGKLLFPKMTSPFQFTSTEGKILEYLSNKDKLVSKSELIDKAFSSDYIVTDNNFNTTLSNLRKKVSPFQLKISAKRNKGLKIEYID